MLVFRLLSVTFSAVKTKKASHALSASLVQMHSLISSRVLSAYYTSTLLPFAVNMTSKASCIQQLAPCVTFALAHLVEAHSFLSFSPRIELCLSGRPGGRRTQRLLHLSPLSNKKNCVHYDLGPCFLNPLHICPLHHILAY